MFSGIPDSVPDSQIEYSKISILSDIDVSVYHGDVEDCHKVGKPHRNNSKKTIIRMVKRKYCTKALVNNRKKLANNDTVKYNFNTGSKIFVNENLVLANEFIAYECCSLKCSGKIHSCFTKNGAL